MGQNRFDIFAQFSPLVEWDDNYWIILLAVSGVEL